MRNIIIYQTDKRDYAYMNWNWAKEHLFNLNDYQEVLNYTEESELDDLDLLEKIFSDGNTGRLHNRFPDNRFRSISVSDIIELDGTLYYVDSFGFKNITEEMEVE